VFGGITTHGLRLQYLQQKRIGTRRTVTRGTQNSGAGVHLMKDCLGHSDISTTFRICAHVRPELRQEIADLFAKTIENG
jgi:hypothetical protein